MEKEQSFNDEIAFIDILLIFWKRKVLIIVAAVVVMILAAVVATSQPEIYQVTAIIEMAKGEDRRPVDHADYYRQKILIGEYDQQIAGKLKLTETEIPPFQVSVPKNSGTLNITLQTENPQKAVGILNELIPLLMGDMQDALDIALKPQFDAVQLEREYERFITANIQFLKVQIAESELELKAFQDNKAKILVGQQDDGIRLLSYLNGVMDRRNMLYTYHSQMEELQMNLVSSNAKIESAKLELNKFDPPQILKEPVVPSRPIKPKKTLMITLALMVGMMGGALLAFLVEYIQRARQHYSPNP